MSSNRNQEKLQVNQAPSLEDLLFSSICQNGKGDSANSKINYLISLIEKYGNAASQFLDEAEKIVEIQEEPSEQCSSLECSEMAVEAPETPPSIHPAPKQNSQVSISYLILFVAGVIFFSALLF